MSEIPEDPPRPAGSRSKWPVLVACFLTLLLGAGGFFVGWTGQAAPILAMVPTFAAGKRADTASGLAFIEVPPLIISLGPEARNRHLRFSARIEVEVTARAEVTALMPRIVDVLNSYLRAVSVHDLEDPGAMVRLRAQMLRRVQIVTGAGRVRDLLMSEFVLS